MIQRYQNIFSAAARRQQPLSLAIFLRRSCRESPNEANQSLPSSQPFRPKEVNSTKVMTGAAIAFLSCLIAYTVQIARSWTLPLLPHPLSLSTHLPTYFAGRQQQQQQKCPHSYFDARPGLLLSSSSSSTARKSSSSSSSSSSTVEISNNDELVNSSILAEIDAINNISSSTTTSLSFPLLRIGKRVGSGSYGTVHQGYLLRSKNDAVVPCIAKRAWTLAELKADIPLQVLKKIEQKELKQRGQEDEDSSSLVISQRTGLASSSSVTSASNSEDLKTRAERCEHYWNVERHCFQKMTKAMDENNLLRNPTSTTGMSVPPLFWGVYQDDGRGSSNDALIPGYGALSLPGKQASIGNFWLSASNGGTEDASKGHKWMVFEFVGTAKKDGNLVYKPAQTLFDAMEVRLKQISAKKCLLLTLLTHCAKHI